MNEYEVNQYVPNNNDVPTTSTTTNEDDYDYEIVENLDNFEMIENFDEMGLSDLLLRGIYSIGYEKPSPIQQKAIVPLISGRDLIAQAQSGTGKTATFSIGLLQRIDFTSSDCQGLILSPTRELTKQTAQSIFILGEYLNVKVATFIGGSSVEFDITEIRKQPHVVVATPGRLLDLLGRDLLDISHLKCFILDEADEMLREGFKESIYEVYKYIPEACQICLFSATMPQEALSMSELFMRNPLKILVKQEDINLSGIRQFYVESGVSAENKMAIVIDLYETLNIAQSIIFCNTRGRVEWLKQQLVNKGFPVSASHGDLPPRERHQILRDFRDGKSRVLISTDLLSRGIDVHGVSLVINFEISHSYEKYIHRIGRAGRFGRKGVAVNLVSQEELETLGSIQTYLGTQIVQCQTRYHSFYK